jgi:hypothetical protein
MKQKGFSLVEGLQVVLVLAATTMFLIGIIPVRAINALSYGISASQDRTTIPEGGESGAYILEAVDYTSTITLTTSTAPTGTVKSTGTVSGGCKFVDSGKGPSHFTTKTTLEHSSIGDKIYVTIYHQDTSSYEGTRTCNITMSNTTSSDSNYDDLTIASHSVEIIDDETAPQPTATSSPAPTPTPSPIPVVEKPEIPTTKLVDAEGNEITPPEGSDKVSFKDKELVVISGVTIPNGIVKLYIFSEPQEAEVTADAEGNWTYTVENLEAGDHRVEVEVTDPATNETSERTEVLAFSVAQAETVEETLATPESADAPVEEDSSSLIPVIAILGILVLAGAVGGYFVWKKRNNTSRNTENTTSTVTNTDIQPVSENSEANIEQESEEETQETETDDTTSV